MPPACQRALAILFLACGLCWAGPGQTKITPAQLQLIGDIPKPLSLSSNELRRLPRKTVKVTNGNGGKEEAYEGVPLAELLREAGLPQGPQLRGRALATYIVAEGADGYRVAFSAAELDSDFQDSDIIVADTLDGAPLSNKIGPLRLVVPHDKEHARWVRMLRSIKVASIP